MKNGKEKKKMAFLLLGKKPDRRSLKNLKILFEHALSHREFSGPQLRRKGIGVTWFYNSLVPRLLRGHVIEESKQEKSAGRGTTQFFRMTEIGLLMASYFVRDVDVLKEVFEKSAEEEENPLTRFSFRCLVSNYPDQVLWSLLTKCFSTAFSMKEGTYERDIQTLFIEGLFDAHAFVAASKKFQRDIFEKNIRLMESAPERKYVFSYFKAQIESHLLNILKGEKLKRYLENMMESPTLFHIPCLNEECTEVITSEIISLPTYCYRCKTTENR